MLSPAVYNAYIKDGNYTIISLECINIIYAVGNYNEILITEWILLLTHRVKLKRHILKIKIISEFVFYSYTSSYPRAHSNSIYAWSSGAIGQNKKTGCCFAESGRQVIILLLEIAHDRSQFTSSRRTWHTKTFGQRHVPCLVLLFISFLFSPHDYKTHAASCVCVCVYTHTRAREAMSPWPNNWTE